jgi:hypothetical protein
MKGGATCAGPKGFVIASVLTSAGVLAGGSLFGHIAAAAANLMEKGGRTAPLFPAIDCNLGWLNFREGIKG